MPGFNLVGNGPLQPSNKIGPNKDIRRSHRWYIKTLIGNDYKTYNDFKLYAKKITIPQLSFEEEVFRSLGGEYKFASLPKFQDVTIEFYDVVGIAEELCKLQNNIWGGPGTETKPQDSIINGMQTAIRYKGTTELIVQTSIGGGVDMKYTLHNSWIKNLTHSELSYERNELKSVTLTLSYDYYTFAQDGNACEGIEQKQSGPVTTEASRALPNQSSTTPAATASSDAPPELQAPIGPSGNYSQNRSPPIPGQSLIEGTSSIYPPNSRFWEGFPEGFPTGR